MLEKARIEGKETYISLLEYRNTPTDVDSPSTLLMSRQLRSILPITKELLKPKVIPSEKTYEKRSKSQYQQKKYFNSGQKDFPYLKPEQKVRFQHKGQWTPGYVKKSNS